jgi:hypothetical protein
MSEVEVESTVEDTVEATTEGSVTETTDVSTNQETTQDDYSWVPEFYVKNGEPDYKGLAEGYKNLQKKLSTKDALPAQSVEQYEYEFGEGFDIDSERVESFKQDALQMGLSPKQYQDVMNKYLDVVGQFAPSQEKAETALKAEWGESFDENLLAANRVWHQVQGQDAAIPVDLGNHPEFIKFLAKLAPDFKEDSVSIKESTTGSEYSSLNIEELRSRPDRWTNPKVAQAISEYYDKAAK